jgi:thiamine-monophosphate kinase
MRDLKIEDIGEQDFIRSIMDNCLFSPERPIKGIGDDCAVIGPFGEKVLLVTTDLLVEDIHFIMAKIPPEHLGEKAAAVNLSDIAAMGGTPLYLFVSLAIPKGTRLDSLHALYQGLKAMCRRYRISLLGGDTCASLDKLMINVVVIGEAAAKEVLYRHGAGPNDLIYVTGTLGASAAGLKVIRGESSAPEPLASALIEAHNRPMPHVEAGRIIAASRLASAMIDLSDGMLSDLRHICEASEVGASLYQSALPLSSHLKALAEINHFDPYEVALSGGEDYGLLITVPEKNTASFEKLFKEGAPCPAHRVGQITKGKGIKLIGADGKEQFPEGIGFDHFIRP